MTRGLYRSRLQGRFNEKTARFVSSVDEDARIFEEDIDGTEAHNIMLYEQKVISRDDLKKILSALEKIRSSVRKGKLVISSDFEDIHEFLEAYVIKEVGAAVGGKLHSGRSRNDQVAVAIRMRVRTELTDVLERVLDLMTALLKGAEKYVDYLMVLYTHSQPAQIGVFSHYLLAYVDVLFRDLQRLTDCFKRVNFSPLGAGPIGGSRLDLNRSRTASLLGFERVLENSIDAVSSRDFALEVVSVLAILMSGLSRIAEDLIVWSSAEFGYIELADEYSSTSSVMPQKRNPCTLELIRGKTGHVYGALTSLLTMVKGLPTGYNRDLQETKPPLWVSFDAVKGSLDVLMGVVDTFKVNKKRMQKAASGGFVMAVDLAELLVKQAGLPFRAAHTLVGNLVRESLDSNLTSQDWSSEMLEDLSERVLGRRITVSDEVLKGAVDTWSSLVERKTVGSPSPQEVKRMIQGRRKMLSDCREEVEIKVKALGQSRNTLMKIVKKYVSV